VSKRRKQAGEAGAKRVKVRDVFVPRPFEGLADEADWIALRELVPAASSPVQLRPEYGDRPVTICTVLPMAWPALTKPDGRIFLGLQRHQQSGDVSRDVAVALLNALEVADLGGPVSVPPLPGEGPRLQDLLVDGSLDVTVHEGFDFWLDNDPGDDPAVAASLERANASIQPTVKLASAAAAYWCRVPEKAHVRWVLTDDEEPALSGLSRLGAASALALGDNTKFAGMFRAHGRLVPVWDLPPDTPAEEWETPLAEFAKRYAEAVASDAELTAAERRTRQGLLGRQLTLR
jgi:hypothetical protein